MTESSTALVAAAILALDISLAGCGATNDNIAGPETSSAPRSSTSSGAGASTSISPPGLKEAPKLVGSEGAVADISYDASTCSAYAGTHEVSGTVTNPTKKPLDYVIMVNWTNDTFDVRGNGVAVLRQVAPGEKVDWSVQGRVADGATRCILLVRRGTLATRG